MKRRHTLIVSSLFGLAAVAGTVALMGTAALGSGTPGLSDADIAARTARITRAEASLRRVRAEQPPALAPLPAVETTVAGPVERVVVVRAAAAAPPAQPGDGDEDDDEHGLETRDGELDD